MHRIPRQSHGFPLPAALAVLLAAGSALAQPAPRPLSLAEAIRTALAQNPRVQQSLLAVAESEDTRRSAAAALMPQVSAEAMGQRNKYNLDALMGMPQPHGPQAIGPFTWTQVGVEARVSVFDLSLWKKWRASQEGEAAARAQGRAVREEITALVAGQYFRGLRAQAAVTAGQSRVELAEALVRLAENQQKQGVGTRLDTLRAQVQLQTERQRLIQAQTQRTTALAGLVRLLSLDPATRLELTDSLSAPALPTGTVEEATREGLAQRPELASLDARDRAADQLRQAAQSLHLPTLVASGTYGSTTLQHESAATTYQLTLGLRVPLFTGGLISAQAARAKSEQLRVQESRREVQAQVGFEVQVARAELDAAAHEVEAADLAVTLSTEALTQARHRFEAGVSNNIEVINAQDELARAQDNHINALYRLNQARADLARATGRIESLYTR